MFKIMFNGTDCLISLFCSRSASLCANSLGLPMYSMPVQSAPASRRGSTTLYNQSLLTPNLPINDVNGRR